MKRGSKESISVDKIGTGSKVAVMDSTKAHPVMTHHRYIIIVLLYNRLCIYSRITAPSISNGMLLWCANHCIMANLVSLRLNSNLVISKRIINASGRRFCSVKSITVMARQGESFLQAQRKIRLEPSVSITHNNCQKQLLTFAIK